MSDCAQTEPKLPGASDVSKALGGWPCFHDAEVLELHLNRKASSWIRLQLDNRRAVVRFELKDLVDLELADFSEQNVVSDLTIEEKEIESPRLGKVPGIRMTLSPCYGLAGYLEAMNVSVQSDGTT